MQIVPVRGPRPGRIDFDGSLPFAIAGAAGTRVEGIEFPILAQPTCHWVVIDRKQFHLYEIFAAPATAIRGPPCRAKMLCIPLIRRALIRPIVYWRRNTTAGSTASCAQCGNPGRDSRNKREDHRQGHEARKPGHTKDDAAAIRERDSPGSRPRCAAEPPPHRSCRACRHPV